MKKVIVILCFVSGNVYVLPYDLPEDTETENFFDTKAAQDLDLRAVDCEWMVTTGAQVNLAI
ncbi:MAG: hypothetical protein ACK5DE_10025 [Bacteroidota bacterium]|jgi:hypothetical protein